MEQKELTRLINLAKDSVDSSAFGPIFMHPDSGNVMDKQVNQIAFGVFSAVLGTVLNAAIQDKRLKIVKESQK